MLKYCNGCKRDLEIDEFYRYMKSTCEECVNKKTKCDYCDKEFNSTTLSKHIEQIHSTYDSSRTNNSTYDSAFNKTNKNNSTSYKTNKNISTSDISLSDQFYVSTYTDSLKNKHNGYDRKDIDKINKIFAINRKLYDKKEKSSINAKEKNILLII